MFAPWFERFPGRLQQERERYEAAGLKFSLNESLLRSKSVVVFEGTVEAGSRQHALRLVYPPGFPYVRPELVCTDSRLARHQNPLESNLCLLPNEEQAWKFRDSGADLVHQAIRLLAAAAEGPVAVAAGEVDAPEPASEWYPYSGASAFILLDAPPKARPGEIGTFRAMCRAPYPTGVGVQLFLMEASLGKGSRWHLPKQYEPLVAGQTIEGVWLSLSEPPPYPETPQEWSAGYAFYLKWLARQRKDVRLLFERAPTIQAYALRYPNEGPRRGEFHEGWLVGLGLKSLSQPSLLRPIMWNAEDHERRVPSLVHLSGKKVAVVGLGAIGKPIAESFARAGVGHLRIVDHDFVDAGPLVRQAYDLRDLGLPKAIAAEWRARLANPRTTVVSDGSRIGGAFHNVTALPDGPDPLTVLADELRGYDLVVSVTGETAVDFILNEIGAALGIPCIYAWAVNGAWGGQVFRFRPGEACYECLMHQWDQPPVADPATTPLYARGCGFPTFTGTGFDAELLANLATRMAVQTILSGEAGAYPDVTSNLINCQNRIETAGRFPHIEHLTIAQHEGCWTCQRYTR